MVTQIYDLGRVKAVLLPCAPRLPVHMARSPTCLTGVCRRPTRAGRSVGRVLRGGSGQFRVGSGPGRDQFGGGRRTILAVAVHAMTASPFLHPELLTEAPSTNMNGCVCLHCRRRWVELHTSQSHLVFAKHQGGRKSHLEPSPCWQGGPGRGRSQDLGRILKPVPGPWGPDPGSCGLLGLAAGE